MIAILERLTRKIGSTSTAAATLLFVSGNACATGLTGGLAGVREAYFMAWGVVGAIPAIMLAIAFSRVKKKRANGLSYFLTVPAILYVPTAIILIFFPSGEFPSKFPGVMGFALLFGLVAFYVSENRLLRRSMNAVLGIVLVALVLIPNEYWKIPLVSFERVEFVDNVAPKELVETLRSRTAPKRLIALEDGRHLAQKVEGLRRNSSGKPVFPSGDAVVLEATSSADAGQWYEVTFFNRTYRYKVSGVSTKARYVFPLSTRSENMYKQSGTALAVLLDDTARVNYERLLAELLRSRGGWSIEPDTGDTANVGHWVKVLTKLADIDMQSPEFLSRAYREKENRFRLRFLIDAGVSPNAVNKVGNTMLHIAAKDGDVYSFKWLLELGADPRLINKKRQTALKVARERFKREPATTHIGRFESLLEDHANPDEPDQ